MICEFYNNSYINIYNNYSYRFVMIIYIYSDFWIITYICINAMIYKNDL
jgi:hypothetical protein